MSTVCLARLSEAEDRHGRKRNNSSTSPEIPQRLTFSSWGPGYQGPAGIKERKQIPQYILVICLNPKNKENPCFFYKEWEPPCALGREGNLTDPNTASALFLDMSLYLISLAHSCFFCDADRRLHGEELVSYCWIKKSVCASLFSPLVWSLLPSGSVTHFLFSSSVRALQIFLWFQCHLGESW